MQRSPDIDHVTRLIQHAARERMVPRFRQLRPDEVLHKETDGYAEDVVTVVDRDVEAWLSAELAALVPGAHIVGEESVHASPDLVRGLESDAPAWIIDPLDGTHNFATGHDGFGIMVAFAVGGVVRAAWVHLPMRGECFVAEAGGGTYLNGSRVRVPETPVPAVLEGSVFIRFMPAPERDALLQRVSGHYTEASHAGAAAVEYTDVLRARKDFVSYYRLLPWDHGAPALLLTEAGGIVEHLDGQPYTLRSSNQVTVVARSRDVGAAVRRLMTT